ncbi:type II toxin-antitoxin system RelE/ParE family toxin [Helicobacter saguini]|uniref:Type II toxin-antitoxin system RelE/ParE family toxin n=1 Tax=Helicobacter saguini TaxID=1548018 RepID=A0A347VN72_9HELI|nr:type II toxin-antitoxin system RelE/ParE family toxin [Helicobacter saguini]MWV61877.1 type II toxin-antitoxin system RelE/ParE family toxin [Helicobacter saguini]MWV67448.1 type II toxin-antitoxin system RelE/ParE family toxin [Helicobacter saguini]MWV69800.1 type II toxin-antitoxin system RelE/ParE family toxin [Helicobacter saguini]MWV72982.1 type II toxin-antitoxin system RelE/ParE family toxin [Helicobacter saguini]TLD95637.1 type II toxin-antitoxin system RelE/ParE family toxin [Helic
MKYTLQIDENELDFVASLNQKDQDLIHAKLDLLECGNFLGDKALKGKHKGKFRKRAGNYRIIYTRQDSLLIVVVININNRKDVYK